MVFSTEVAFLQMALTSAGLDWVLRIVNKHSLRCIPVTTHLIDAKRQDGVFAATSWAVAARRVTITEALTNIVTKLESCCYCCSGDLLTSELE